MNTSSDNSANLIVDKTRCMGCRICELTCSFHFHQVFNPERARIRIFFKDDGQLDIRVSSSCSCRDPAPCIRACPVEALRFNQKASHKKSKG